MLALVPEETTVRRLDDLVNIPTEELSIGDTIVLRAGARMPTDGIVSVGWSTLDLSAVTGESIPIEVGPGDRVIAGSINVTGVLDVAATTDPSDSTLARIVHTVEEAQDRKGRSQRLADRIARPLVPAIMLTAAGTCRVGRTVR